MTASVEVEFQEAPRKRRDPTFCVRTESASCKGCWRSFERKVGGRGAKRKYCCTECQKFHQAFEDMRDTINVVRDRCTEVRWKVLRSWMFQECNVRPWNAGKKGLIAATVIRGANGRFLSIPQAKRSPHRVHASALGEDGKVRLG